MVGTINPESGLNARQEAFCRFYLEDLNATRAAVRAGYSERTAYTQGSRLLRNVQVRKFLAKLQKPMLDRLEVTQQQVLEQTVALAFSNIASFIQRDPETGEAWIDVTKCASEDLRALAAFEVVELPPQKLIQGGKARIRKVRHTKIRMRDSWPALAALIKRFDLINPDTTGAGVQNQVDKTDTLEIVRRAAFMLREAAEDRKKGG